MSIQGILVAALIVGAIGIFIGLFLGIAGIKFKVEVDPKEEAHLHGEKWYPHYRSSQNCSKD